MFLATIKNNKVSKNRDSDNQNRMIDCEISSPEDIQSVELSNISGEDTNPLTDDVVLVLSIADAYKIGLLVDDGIDPDPTIKGGEKEFYSRSDQTNKAAKIRLKKNSEIILNDGTDYAVAFEKLKTEFEELQQKFNTHIHPGVASGGSSTGVTTQLSTAVIDNVKVEKVRL